jgi:ArsR family transcriptional regulator
MLKRIFALMHIQPDSFYKALADTTRLRCLMLLTREGELCVCELTHALDAPQPKVSRHLATLREVGLVLDRRQGLWIYYRIHPELPNWMREVIRETAVGVAALEPFHADQLTLAEMPNRPGGRCCA